MLVTLTTRTSTSKPMVAAPRLGILARALIAGGSRVRALTLRLALSVVGDACRPADGGVDAGEDSGLVEARRTPALRGRTGVVCGYVFYTPFDLPLIARLPAGPRLDVVVSEPPPTTGTAVRIACAVRRVLYIYYCADIVSDIAAFVGVLGFAMCMTTGLESFVLRGVRHVTAMSDGVARYVCDVDTRNVAVVPNGMCISEVVTTGTPEGLSTCGGPVFVYTDTAAQWLAPEVSIDAFERMRARLENTRLVSVG